MTKLNCVSSFKFFVDDVGLRREIGELWFDRSGNQCFFRENGTISCTTINLEPSMTIQSEKDSCDVNLIVAKYIKTGMMTNYRTSEPQYGDFSSSVDYHDAILRAQQAEDSFMLLPASIRTRFSNDPGKLIDFLNDSENRLEAIELGLLTAPQAPQMPLGDVIPPSKEGG